MLADINLFGVFIDIRFATAVAALLLLAPVRMLLGAIGAYRMVWHPALADVAIFVLLWGACALVTLSNPALFLTYIG